mgnify:FL=1
MPKFMTTFTIGLLLFSTASEASIRVQLERIDPSVSKCIKAMEKGVSLPKTSGDAGDISTYHWFYYDKKLFRISFGTTSFRCRASQFK